jgi:aspartyl-tRNA(Asn)/glutamyl-tRNA(Gln) amidotransferase subunit A
MLSVITGPDDRDRHSLPAAAYDWTKIHEGDIKGCRVAYSADWGYAPVDPRVRQIVGKAVEVFERDLGCEVVEADPGWPNPFDAFWGVVANDSDLRGMRKMIDDVGEDRISPHLVDFIRKEWTAEEFTDAQIIRKTVVNKMWRFMQDYDLLLTPTLAVPAFEIGIQGPTLIEGREVADTEWLHFTFPINFTGQPAASAPAGWTEDGLPVGLQIIGRHLDDALVLRASAAFEEAAPWADRWPDLLKDMGL